MCNRRKEDRNSLKPIKNKTETPVTQINKPFLVKKEHKPLSFLYIYLKY